ncbi:MAG: ATP-binding protein [Microcoleaceae cyanobacterium]
MIHLRNDAEHFPDVMPIDHEAILNRLYNAFAPDKPLPAGDPQYVDCKSVRGEGDVLVDLGRKIQRSDDMTCQLYSGHRGGGKSTELLRLKKDLEDKGFFVVYFPADANDVEIEDTQYTDILLACTRHLLENLQDVTKPDPLTKWLGSRWQELKDLALSDVEFDKVDASAQIAQFAKLTANIRAVPSLRAQIRQKVEPYTVTLLDALNTFIQDAKKKLPDGKTRLAVIVDNLDRMVPVIIPEMNRINHEEIFLDRAEQLKGLDCHLIYTVPLSMLYSRRAIEVEDIYGEVQVLPMIMVHHPDGDPNPEGIAKTKEMIGKRVEQSAPGLDLEAEVFESAEVVERLCLMSGGDMRNLITLTRNAIDHTETLPISKRAAQRSITQLRDTYRRTVEDSQWELLAHVARHRVIKNDDEYRQLLFNRCVLQYCYFDQEQEQKRWYDIHPLIRNVQEFQHAFSQIQG